MTEAKSNIWPSATGILRDLTKGEGAKGPFARFKIEIAYKDKPGTFTKKCAAFGDMVAVVEALGVGNRIRVRGPEDTGSFVNAEGKTITTKTIMVRSAEIKPVQVEAEATDMAAAA
jgi:protein-L-isoaspartate O-methyltransferase